MLIVMIDDVYNMKGKKNGRKRKIWKQEQIILFMEVLPREYDLQNMIYSSDS